MRQARLKLDPTVGPSVYHCITRVVAGERLLGDVEKEILRRMLWRVAAFCGVEVLSYCIMSNHFHVLVRVPELRPEDLSRKELLRRYRILYGDGRAGFFPEPEVLEALFEDPDNPDAQRWERRLRARMNDISPFMQTLKQRFSIWFNKTRGRFGTLWAERFKSVLVQNDPDVLRVVAAYIDLNPVRAGLVEAPEAYRWSTYGEAMGGNGEARAALAAAMGHASWRRAMTDYRLLLFGKAGDGRVGEQARIPPEKVREVIDQGGKVLLRDLLRCRLRYLSDGAALGSQAFVKEVEARFRGEASRGRRRRKRGLIPNADGPEILALRRLRRRVVS